MNLSILGFAWVSLWGVFFSVVCLLLLFLSLNSSHLCKHYISTYSQSQEWLGKVQLPRLIIGQRRNWPKPKKNLVACKHLTLCDILACSQKLTWTLLWLYLDQRCPRATWMSEQMGLINHLMVSFTRAVSSSLAEEPSHCCVRGIVLVKMPSLR